MSSSETNPLFFETRFESTHEYSNPTWDVSVDVLLTSPSGKQLKRNAFWDGGKIWGFRFSSFEPGEWTYEVRSSDTSNTGLNGKRGKFQIGRYKGEHSIFRHGSLKVSENGHYLTHQDGTPFFWLGDTAWNGVLKAHKKDWDKYLSERKQQGFTVIQGILTHWRAFEKDAAGEVSFTVDKQIRINPAFFQRIDSKVAAVNEHGLIPAMVLLWSYSPTDPGYLLEEKDCVHLAKYLVSRYGAHQIVWFLGGDDNQLRQRAQRWDRIAREVFPDGPNELTGMHPGGMMWIGEEVRPLPWCQFIGYQSGHNDSEDAMRWIVDSQLSEDWKKMPHKPVLNLEPPYEDHIAYASRQRLSDHDVRRATYWSLMVTPTAGATYGHHAIWPWNEKKEVPLNHERSGDSGPWHAVLQSRGAQSMSILRKFFESLPWWKLVPAPEALVRQPGETDARYFVTVAKTSDDSHVIAYLPAGGNIGLRKVPNLPAKAKWFNPRSGEWTTISSIHSPFFFIEAPSKEDWVLWLGPWN